MIKSKNGELKIKAECMEEMMADLTVAIKGVYQTLVDDEELTREEASEVIQECVRLASFDDEEELHKYMVKRTLERMLKDLESEDEADE